MIYKLANSFSHDNCEDLFQVGVIGLIQAYYNYDKSYDTKFSTYAYSYILGQMKKYMRENKSIKISRDIQYLTNRLDKLIGLLSQKYKREPTTKELSIETGIEEWKIIEALNTRNCIKSLDEPIKNDGKEITMLDITKNEESRIDNLEFDELINILDEDEQKFIKYRYFYDKSQMELSEIMGYSQAKVSRKEEKILEKLRKYYE